MRKLLYTIAVILIIGWGIGYFGFGLGAAIHALLVIALVIIVMRMATDKKAL